jgi:CheY-like chemotaxis protein
MSIATAHDTSTPLSHAEKSILVVDDEENIRGALSRLLKSNYESYSVDTASSAEEAVALLEENDFDILVTDFRLPEMNGLELTEWAQSQHPGVKSILMTAFGNDEMVQEAHENGCVAYLEKPLDVDLLFHFIEEASRTRCHVSLHVDDCSLGEVLQFFSMRNKSVMLRAQSGDKSGILSMQDGLLTHVEFGQLQGGPALIDLLNSNNLELETLSEERPAIKTLALSWLALNSLLEAPTRRNQEEILKLYHLHQLRSSKAIGFSKNDSSLTDLIKDFKANRLQVHKTANENDSINSSLEEEQERKYETDSCESPEKSEGDAEKDAEWVRLLVNEGVQHFRSHKFEKAKECWQEALRLDPDCDQAQQNLEILSTIQSVKA